LLIGGIYPDMPICFVKDYVLIHHQDTKSRFSCMDNMAEPTSFL
jgi:hypothetical protein